MSKTILAVAITAALTLPLIAIEAAPAIAGSAHNVQAGTSTTNPHDSRRSAQMKQRRNRRGY